MIRTQASTSWLLNISLKSGDHALGMTAPRHLVVFYQRLRIHNKKRKALAYRAYY